MLVLAHRLVAATEIHKPAFRRHPVVYTYEVPQADQSSEALRNFRRNVTLTKGDRSYGVPGHDLFSARRAASVVHPLTAEFHWDSLDFLWYIEGCCRQPSFAETDSGFHDINRLITLGTHPGTDRVAIPQDVRAACETSRLLNKRASFLQDQRGGTYICKWWNGCSASLDLTHPEAVKVRSRRATTGRISSS
jgi:hypothetical protein